MAHMMDATLNIAGGEWIIIALAAIILLVGTNRLPEAARKMGRIAGEYTKTKNEIAEQVSGAAKIHPTKPVESEREKLDMMARTLGIAHDNKTDDELRRLIADRVGGRKDA